MDTSMESDTVHDNSVMHKLQESDNLQNSSAAFVGTSVVDDNAMSLDNSTDKALYSEQSEDFSQQLISINWEEYKRQTYLDPDQPPDAKVLKLAILGNPNAGKSTLMNQLIGRQVAAVSCRVHTTIRKSNAVFTEGDTQIIFTDTPGLTRVGKKQKFQKIRSETLNDPKKSLPDADIICVIIDATDKWDIEFLPANIMRLLMQHKDKKSFLVLNKVDEVKSKTHLLQIMRHLTDNSLNGVPNPENIEKKSTNPSTKKKKKIFQKTDEALNIKYKTGGEPVPQVKKDTKPEYQLLKTANPWDDVEKKEIRNMFGDLDVDKKVKRHKSKRVVKVEDLFDKMDKYREEKQRKSESLKKEISIDLPDENEVTFLGYDTEKREGHSCVSSSQIPENENDSFSDSKPDFCVENKFTENEIFNRNNDVRDLNSENMESSKTLSFEHENTDMETQLDSVLDFAKNQPDQINTSEDFDKRFSKNFVDERLAYKTNVSGADTEAEILSEKEGTISDDFKNKIHEVDADENLSRKDNDKCKKEQIPDAYLPQGWAYFDKVFYISAKDGDGVEEMKDYLLDNAIPGDWKFHSSVVTPEDPYSLAEQIVHGKILELVVEETPYLVFPKIESWGVDNSGVLWISMNIETPKKYHYKKLLGAEGFIIRTIVEEAQQALMDLFYCEVYLKLAVRCKELELANIVARRQNTYKKKKFKKK